MRTMEPRTAGWAKQDQPTERMVMFFETRSTSSALPPGSERGLGENQIQGTEVTNGEAFQSRIQSTKGFQQKIRSRTRTP